LSFKETKALKAAAQKLAAARKELFAAQKAKSRDAALIKELEKQVANLTYFHSHLFYDANKDARP